jgi:hypothetical protein
MSLVLPTRLSCGFCEWRSIAASASVAKYPVSGEDYADAYWQLLAGSQVFPNIETSKDDYLLWDQTYRKPFRLFQPLRGSISYNHFLSFLACFYTQ